MPYFGVGVYPSMNPSRVQLRRYAIPGFACHTDPEALIDLLYCLQVRSVSHLSHAGSLLSPNQEILDDTFCKIAEHTHDQEVPHCCCGARSHGWRSTRIGLG